MMRQAGRYLKEYRDIRSKYPFMTMVKTPELATTVTLQPIERFGFDAAIIFSDILVVAEALGGQLEFVEGIGPVFHNPVRAPRDLTHLNPSDIEEKLNYVCEAIKLTKQSLNGTPLIGFAGAPFTVASYMVEGRPSQTLRNMKSAMYDLKPLLDMITEATITYLNAQVEAGVDAIQIFDTWAGLLSLEDFMEFSVPYIQRIISTIKVPVTVFCKGRHAPKFQDIGANVIGFDWQTDLGEIRQSLRPSVGIQGNMDPCLFFASAEVITRKTNALVDKMSDRPGYIFNLGHGILPETDPEKVRLVVDLVKNAHYR